MTLPVAGSVTTNWPVWALTATVGALARQVLSQYASRSCVSQEHILMSALKVPLPDSHTVLQSMVTQLPLASRLSPLAHSALTTGWQSTSPSPVARFRSVS